jgi:hypothetical protein
MDGLREVPSAAGVDPALTFGKSSYTFVQQQGREAGGVRRA